jgi:hypothetical protein
MKQFRDTGYWITEDGIIHRKRGGFYTNNGLSPNGKPTQKWRPEKWQICKPHPNHEGYLRYSPFINGKYIGKCVHQLVAECYLGPCPVGYEVDHIDNNKLNNHYTNLQYLTKADNIKKAHPKKNF